MTAVTLRLTVAVLVRPSEEPVTVTATVPVAALLLAVKVNVLVPVVLPGLNEAVTPAGKPEVNKLTLLLKPLNALTEMVMVPLSPWTTVKLLGEAESVKFP